MMKNISLLPAEYKNQKRSVRKLNITTVAMMIVVGVAVFVYTIVKILSSVPASELKVLQAEHELLSGEMNTLMTYHEMAQDIRDLGDQARNAVAGEPDWIRLFSGITESVPEGLQITGISADTKDNKTTAVISGSAQNHETVAAWLETLKQQKAINEARLQNSLTAAREELNGVVQFELHIAFAPDIAFVLFKEAEQ